VIKARVSIEKRPLWFGDAYELNVGSVQRLMKKSVDVTVHQPHYG
jgi:hypothetical protein